MGAERTKRDVYPRGPEGQAPEGGWTEGESLVDPEAAAAINREVGRVEALDLAGRVAKAEGAKAAQAVLDREKETKSDRLMAFRSFLLSLEDLAGKDASAAANPDETRLVLKLYRQEDNGGPKPTSTYQTAANFGAAEALGLGDPDFEGRAQAWAEKTGRFGRYQWRVLGWAGGEQTLDTTYVVQVEPPPGYEVPRPTKPEAEPERDPMANLKEGLGIIAMVKETLGGNAAGGKVDLAMLEAARTSARTEARAEALLEGDRLRREELLRLEDRWEAKVEKAEKEGYARGLEAGRRAAEDELRPRLWELERKAEGDREPSILEEASRLMGGPEVVQGLVKAVIGSMERQAPPVPAMGRPVMPLQARPNPMQAQPAAPPPPPLPEPTRKEWREALEDVEEVLEILDEHGDGSADTRQLKDVLEAFKAQGEGDGPLGPWWQAWNAGIRMGVEEMLTAAHGAEDETMDLDGFKALLALRLDEGAEDAAILAELEAQTTPQQRSQWRGLLRWMPEDVAAGMLGEDRHRARLVVLLDAFKA